MSDNSGNRGNRVDNKFCKMVDGAVAERQINIMGLLKKSRKNEDVEVLTGVLRLGVIEIAIVANMPKAILDDMTDEEIEKWNKENPDRPADRAPWYCKIKLAGLRDMLRTGD